jgi:L-alanine-DL-glutamate epimerase-like enolase superfamily enzyme
LVIEGLSGIDIALCDIKGKHFGVPIHQLMGGPLRTKAVPVPLASTAALRETRCTTCPRRPPATRRRASTL